MKKILLILAIALIVLVIGCSEDKAPDTATTAPTTTQPEPAVTTGTETSVPLEDMDIDELRSLEITPSGDPECFLSPCDCNCYLTKNVPLTQKRPMCASNCKDEYGINGCVFREYRCSAIQS